jgi:hypothetical protein
MTAPAAPPTTAPTGPPTTAPVTAPPAAPVKAPLSSARAIVPAPKKVAPARARAESFIRELPLSKTPRQNGRRGISFHFGRSVLGVSSRQSAEQIRRSTFQHNQAQGDGVFERIHRLFFTVRRRRSVNLKALCFSERGRREMVVVPIGPDNRAALVHPCSAGAHLPARTPLRGLFASELGPPLELGFASWRVSSSGRPPRLGSLVHPAEARLPPSDLRPSAAFPAGR